jgi:hypothetical protein
VKGVVVTKTAYLETFRRLFNAEITPHQILAFHKHTP